MTIVLYLILILALVIGLWGLACLLGGLGKSGGPVKLIKAWLRAIGGG